MKLTNYFTIIHSKTDSYFQQHKRKTMKKTVKQNSPYQRRSLCPTSGNYNKRISLPSYSGCFPYFA